MVYAYARQGAAAAYPKIALESISEVFSSGTWHMPTKDDAKKAWERYKVIAKEKYNMMKRDKGEERLQVNEKMNPMNEDGGVLIKMASNNISNIAAYVKCLVGEGRTGQAHDFIKSIRGIGGKISSLYL